MSAHQPGGAAVGRLSDLDPVGAAGVLYLRLWSGGPADRAQVWSDFAALLGEPDGRAALQRFERLVALCAGACRRPLIRHDPHCPCLGADESCLALLLTSMLAGAREDALLIAALMVRADLAPALTASAESVALDLKRLTLRAMRHEDRRAPLH